MAEKKAILILASNAEFVTGSNIEKILKKAAITPYMGGDIDIFIEKVDGHCRITAANIAEEIQKGTALSVVTLQNGDDTALDNALGPVLEATDRRTTIIIAGKNALLLYGQGIAKAAEINSSANAADIIPTIAYVADVSLPDSITEGRVLYATLKDPNVRLKEIAKLQESVRSMQAALERDSRAPWDKHDCA